MAVTSASTDDQVQAQIDDNANYDEIRSLASARAYRTALRIMIGRLERRSKVEDGGNTLETRTDGLKAMMAEVQSWLGVNDTDDQAQSGALAIDFDMSNFRP